MASRPKPPVERPDPAVRAIHAADWHAARVALRPGEMLVAAWTGGDGKTSKAPIGAESEYLAALAHGPDVRFSAVRRRDAGPDVQRSPALDPASIVSFDDALRSHELSEAVAAALDASEKAAAAAELPITTSLLLQALHRRGAFGGDAQSTGDVLRRHVDEVRLESAIQDYVVRARRNYSAPRHLYPRPPVSRRVADVLANAARIAGETAGKPEIHARHIVAGLLDPNWSGPENGALARLREAGADAIDLRARLFETFVGRGDDDAAWERWFADTTPRLAGFATDSPEGTDLLDVEREAKALAALIAARDVSPPLAVGLFGDWGSGKSFFMRCIRAEVGRLARRARESRMMQCELPAWKYIAQIEFNAWHYLEGNLWASLVEHILQHLTTIENDDGETKRAQRRFLAQLEAARRDVASAEQALVAAKAELDDAKHDSDEAACAEKSARDKLAAAEAALERERELLAETSAPLALHLIELPAVRAALAPTLERLGIPKATAAADDLRAAIGEAHAVLGRASSVLLPALRAPDRGRRVMWLGASLVAGPVAAFGADALARAVGAQSWVPSVSAAVAAVGGSLTAWVRTQGRWVAERADELKKADDAYVKAVDDQRAQRAGTLKSLQENVSRLEQERENAAKRHQDAERAVETSARRLDEARRKVEDADRAIEETTPQRLLAHYLDDRTRSDDYRKLLGVVARIRADFDKISRLVEEGNWRLLPGRQGDRDRPELPKFESLVDEEKDAGGRIDRIVLYIDDLDRCPPDRVVEVLEAVHLLLAFPLFVVVVAVDVRWVRQALARRYEGLLGGVEAQDAKVVDRANVADYLEKIFQIPLHVRPLDSVGTRSILGALAARPPALAARPGDAASGPPRPPESSSGQEITEVVALLRSAAAAGRSAPRDRHGEAVTTEKPMSDAERMAQLDVAPHELSMMNELAPLLGRSPRALKRFVNVFRLLKASLRRTDAALFARETDPSHRAVLFLLAMEVGAPRLAPRIFAAAMAALDAAERGGIPDWLHGVLDATETERAGDGSIVVESNRVRAWLAEHRPSGLPYLTPAITRRWAPIVSRFGFSPEEVAPPKANARNGKA